MFLSTGTDIDWSRVQDRDRQDNPGHGRHGHVHHKDTPLQPSTDATPYPGQFATVPDLLFIAIPRMDIMAEILVRGESRVLEDLYRSVAVIADAVGAAMGDADA